MSNVATELAAALADRYQIDRELGAGGMATVYLARDVKHDRQVAIKVLRPELAAVIGAQRFLTEIRTTANLQHPHILPLFDSGSVGGTVFYVMPFVAGESLRDRLDREKQLPVPDAVRIATEVAGALDYAHRHGIIHRDIKPENILLHDGRALVADFGIALAATSAGTRMTETGMSLGTPHYMSPEQAMGEREIDARADLFSLGCVAYEMLTGEPPFTGPTAQAIVARIITEDPKPPIQLRRAVPEAVNAAILTALEKLPADRWPTAASFASALAEGEPARAGAGTRIRSRGRRRSSWPFVGGAALVALVSGAIGWTMRGESSGPPMVFGQVRQVTSNPGLEVLPSISPDGRSVAYAVGTWDRMRIFVRPVLGGRAAALTDDSLDVQTGPSWSPDGTRVLFVSNGVVFSAPSSGGTPRQEIPRIAGASPVAWAQWAPDGKTIAFVVGDSLLLREEDGKSRILAQLNEPNLCSWSQKGTQIACAVGNAMYAGGRGVFANLAPSRIVICSLKDGTVNTITDSTTLNHSPVWSSDDRWIFFVSNRLGGRDVFAQRLTRGSKADGLPVRLTTGIGAHSISLTRDGKRLAFASLNSTSNVWSLPVSPGEITAAAMAPVTYGSQTIEGVTVSHDSRWLFYDSNLNGNADLYRMRLPDGEPEQLTFDASDEFAPQLSPDGRELAYHSFRGGSRDIYLMPLDGGAVQSVAATPMQEGAPVWRPDGGAIAFFDLSARGGIWITKRHADGTWAPAQRRGETGGVEPVWSPDGKWLVSISKAVGGTLMIMSPDSGPARILVDPAEPGMPAPQKARFGDDATALYFKSRDERGRASIWSVPPTGGKPKLRVRFDDSARPSNNPRWDVGGGRFYFTIDDWQSDIRVIDVIAKSSP